MAHHRGDDLDDDFMPDETVALSEDEGFASLVGDHDDIGKLLSADEDEGEQVDLPKEQPNLLSEKKRKRREKEKERKAKEGLTPSKHYHSLFLTRSPSLNRSESLTRLQNQVTTHPWRRGPPPQSPSTCPLCKRNLFQKCLH
jgi:hypothetical protein